MNTEIRLLIFAAAFCATALMSTGAAQAQQVQCAGVDDFPCSFQIRDAAIQPVPTLFKFQSRISQAKLPVGDAAFDRIVVNLKRGTEVLCQEQFVDVRVVSSVLNLEIGRNMSCEVDQVIAENHDLSFQVCIGGSENCLRPVALGTTAYAVKSTFSTLAQEAHTADVSSLSHYAHRVTADRDLFVTHEVGAGYFDFYTPAGAPNLYSSEAFEAFDGAGFVQWTPTRAEEAVLHISAKDHATDSPTSLRRLILVSGATDTTGRLNVRSGGVHVVGASDVTGNTTIRGQLKVERPAGGGPDGAHVAGNSTITGTLSVSDVLSVRSGGAQVIGDSAVTGAFFVSGSATVGANAEIVGTTRSGGALTVVAGGAHVTGDSELVGDLLLSGNQVTTGTTRLGGAMTVEADGIHVAGDSDFTGELLLNGNQTTTGTTRLAQSMTVDAGGIHVVGDSDFTGELLLNGNQRTTGTTTLAQTMTVEAGGIDVTGDSDFEGSVQVSGTVTGVGSVASLGDTFVGSGAGSAALHVHKFDGSGFGNAVSSADANGTNVLVVNAASDFGEVWLGGVQTRTLGSLEVQGDLLVSGAISTGVAETLQLQKNDGTAGVVADISPTDQIVINPGGTLRETVIDGGSFFVAGTLHSGGNNIMMRRTDGSYGRVASRDGANYLHLNAGGDLGGRTVIGSELYVTGAIHSNASDLWMSRIDGSEGRAVSRGPADYLFLNAGGDLGGRTIVDSELHVTGRIHSNATDFMMLRADGSHGRALSRDDSNGLVLNAGGEMGGETRVESSLSVVGQIRSDDGNVVMRRADGSYGRAISRGGSDVLFVNAGGDLGAQTTVDSDLHVSGRIHSNANDVMMQRTDGTYGRVVSRDGANNLVLNAGGDMGGQTLVDSGMTVTGSVQINGGTLRHGHVRFHQDAAGSDTSDGGEFRYFQLRANDPVAVSTYRPARVELIGLFGIIDYTCKQRAGTDTRAGTIHFAAGTEGGANQTAVYTLGGDTVDISAQWDPAGSDDPNDPRALLVQPPGPGWGCAFFGRVAENNG